MKKNLLQLLGIAFVVAIAATGLFYNLLAGRLRGAATSGAARTAVVAARDLMPGTVLSVPDLKSVAWGAGEVPEGTFTRPSEAANLTVVSPIHAGEPITVHRVASADGNTEAGMGIPQGMRAVSVRVSEAGGVVNLLERGHRVDVQVVVRRGQSEPTLRTVLQNVMVLAADRADPRSGRSVPVVTLLAAPAEADMLALADAAAAIRLILRNPLDGERTALAGITVPVMLQGRQAPPVARVAATPPESEGQVRLRVRIAGASEAALEEFAAHLVEPTSDGRVARFLPSWSADEAIAELGRRRLLQVFSTSDRVAADQGRVTISKQAGPWALRVHVIPAMSRNGELCLRLRREMSRPEKNGIATQLFETEMEVRSGQSLLVRTGDAGGLLAENLFPRREDPADRSSELVVLLTPLRDSSTPHGSAAQTAALRKD